MNSIPLKRLSMIMHSVKRISTRTRRTLPRRGRTSLRGKTALTAEQAALTARLATLSETRNSLAAERALLDATRTDLSADQARLAAEQASLAAEQAKLDAEQANLNARLAALNADQDDIAAVQAGLDADQVALDADDAELAVKRGELDALTFQHPEDPGDGFVPDITGVIGFSQAWGGIYAKGGYDESASAGTVAVGVHVNIPNAPNSSFRAGLFFATGENDYAPNAPVTGYDTEWSVAASYKHQFIPAFSGVLGGQYFEDFHGDNSYLIQGAVVRVPAPGQMDIRLETHYNGHDAAEDGAWSGFLRFRRYF